MTFFRTTDRCEREQDRTQSGPVDAGSLLALQLRVPFEVGFLRCGLMASAPDRPGDDEGRFNATLDQTPGNTTDFLE